MPRKKGVGDGDSAEQKRTRGALPDAVRATKKSSTPVSSGTTELVVREFMEDESVKPWLIKIKGLCRHLKMSLTGWSCFVNLCEMRHVTITKPPIGGQTRWGGHHEQVL